MILYMEHINFHTKTCVFTAPDIHSAYMHTVYTSLNYTCIRVQPAGKQEIQSDRQRQAERQRDKQTGRDRKLNGKAEKETESDSCLLYTSPSPRD